MAVTPEPSARSVAWPTRTPATSVSRFSNARGRATRARSSRRSPAPEPRQAAGRSPAPRARAAPSAPP
jgi:hypothetical protein